MEVVIDVKGMSCAHCEKSVKDTVSQLGGVHDVSINLDEGKVEVHYDKNVVSLEAICEVIENIGYDVAR